MMEEQNERFDLSESIADLDVRTSKLLEAMYLKNCHLLHLMASLHQTKLAIFL